MGKNPILVIMAAGMGSRFGGLKQIQPVDEQGHIIIDFSLYDAWKAGFRKIVFVIKKEFEQIFREQIGDRMKQWFQVDYVFQDLSMLPEGFAVPEGREKPWGTGHAIACCRGTVDAPFAVINADDFYGPEAFTTVYQYLSSLSTGENQPEAGSAGSLSSRKAVSEGELIGKEQYAMVGYRLRNTVTEHGSVSRGVCEVEDERLVGITERTKIYKDGENARYTEDGTTFTEVSGDTIVSMNLWGFSANMINELWKRFPLFLQENLPVNPKKCEFFLPTVVNQQIEDGSAEVYVLPCEETWFGVTYKEDLENVVNAIRNMKDRGIYKEELWK